MMTPFRFSALLLVASLSACSLTDLAGEPPSLYQLTAPKAASEAATHGSAGSAAD
jgi:hypothetical protein